MPEDLGFQNQRRIQQDSEIVLPLDSSRTVSDGSLKCFLLPTIVTSALPRLNVSFFSSFRSLFHPDTRDSKASMLSVLSEKDKPECHLQHGGIVISSLVILVLITISYSKWKNFFFVQL